MKTNFPFFSRKNIAIVIISTTVVCLTGITGVYLYSWRGANQLKKTSTSRTKTAASKEEQAIQKAEQYFKDTLPAVQPSQRLFLDYLQRKFDLDAQFSAAVTPIDLHEDPRTYPEEIHFLARIAFPDKLVTSQPKSVLDSISFTNVYSANCDHITLPPNFWDVIRKNVATGGYQMTHTALALQFLEDNDCPIPEVARKISGEVTNKMIILITEPETTPDLRYEAVSFILLGDQKQLIKPEWIEQIIAEQHDEGGWGMQKGDEKSNDHASLLAMWALLEYARPSTPDQPIIRRPAQAVKP